MAEILQTRLQGPTLGVQEIIAKPLPSGLVMSRGLPQSRGDAAAWISVGLAATCTAEVLYDWWRDIRKTHPDIRVSVKAPSETEWRELHEEPKRSESSAADDAKPASKEGD